MDGLNDQWEELAHEIILRAVADYKLALKTLNKKAEADMEVKAYRKFMIKKQDARIRVNEIENFFRSAWFNDLTDCEGDKILKALKTKYTKV